MILSSIAVSGVSTIESSTMEEEDTTEECKIWKSAEAFEFESHC
jgi:hypothetical protein